MKQKRGNGKDRNRIIRHKKRDGDNRIHIQALSASSFSLLIKALPDCSKYEPDSRQATSHTIKSLITSTANVPFFLKKEKETIDYSYSY